jgi:glycosyltransferase involved in cell wall biosynthesis
VQGIRHTRLELIGVPAAHIEHAESTPTGLSAPQKFRSESMTEQFVSVVTCVYDDEPYLEECIKSVLAQTHHEFEYIICNNHSTDRSGEIAADYAAKDSRIRVVSPPEFLPQAKNFNFALRQIADRAKYCKMLHSDDWMYPQCLQQMIEVADSNPRIVLVGAYRLNGDKPDCFGVPIERSRFSGKEACRWQLLGTVFPFGTQSTVMYRAEVIRNRAPSFFPENRFFMDVDIAFRILADGDFGFVHQILTFSRDQPDSLTDRARHLNFSGLLHYLMMEQYGRDFLSAEEFKERYDEVIAGLYRGMGAQWLRDMVRLKRKKEFWKFQRQQLGDIGVEIRLALLVKGVLTTGLHLLGSLGTLKERLR